MKHILTLLFSTIILNNIYSQVEAVIPPVGTPVTDQQGFWQRSAQFIEQKQWAYNDALRSMEVIQQMKTQLQKLDSMKRWTEDRYKFALKVHDDLKTLGAIVEGGYPAFINIAEIILDESLNPADYMPNVGPVSMKFKEAIYYNASSSLSQRTKEAHAMLFEYDVKNPQKYTEMGILTHIGGLFDAKEDWRSAYRNIEINESIKSLQIADEEYKNARKELKRIMSEHTSYYMSEAERLEMAEYYRTSMINAETRKLRAIEKLEEITTEAAREEVTKTVYNQFEINLNVSIDVMVSDYSKNKGWSLVNYSKQRGKRNDKRPNIGWGK